MKNQIENYLESLPQDQRHALERIRLTNHRLVPNVTEGISINVPAFYYKDKYLISMNASKKHMGFLVMQGDIINKFKDELKGYDLGNRVIRFTPENPLSEDIIKKIILSRVEQINQNQ